MSVLDLIIRIFTYNVLTFGNGPVMVPLLQADLVDQRGMLTLDQLLYAFTIARVTPGQANMYVASIGYFLFGIVGAAACILAIVLPGYLMLPLMRGYDRLRGVTLVQGFTRGLTTASVGLIFAATLSIGRRTIVSPVAGVVFVVTLVLVQFLKWNILLSLTLASLVGLVLKTALGL